jgi:hypothetical protein
MAGISPLSPLSPYYPLIIDAVTYFGQLTSSQIRRLFYTSGTPNSMAVGSRRNLTTLTKLGHLQRAWGAHNGVVEYVYQLPGKGYVIPKPHKLAVAELYVRLVESGVEDLIFTPEPWCWDRVGHIQLEPDGYIEAGGTSYWLELDLSKEWVSQLTAKCRRYIQAIDCGAWPKVRAFPYCLWVVPDKARKLYLENIIKKMEPKNQVLFKVVLFDEAAGLLTERKSNAVLPTMRDGI